jgi:hypothetical protein
MSDGCSLELHGPERLPRLTHALALLHPITVLTTPSPSRPELDGSLLGHMPGRKDNRPRTVLHTPGENLALAVPVPERQPLLLGIPAVERLPLIGGITVSNDVPVADELPVEYPLEAVLVRGLAIGKGAHPAVPDQELQWAEIRCGALLGNMEERESREGREGSQSSGGSHDRNMGPAASRS